MRARNRSVNETGKPMKIPPIMASSMTSPRASAKVMVLDLDLLVHGQELAGSPRPEALQELRDALHEQHERGQWNDAAQRPQNRPPSPGARALVDGDRIEEIVDRDIEQDDHRRQEQQQKDQAVDHALGAV